MRLLPWGAVLAALLPVGCAEPPLTVVARPDPADLPLLEHLVLDVCR